MTTHTHSPHGATLPLAYYHFKLTFDKFSIGRLDSYPAPQAASWIRLGTQTTDAYLIQLAHTNKATLVTIEEGMPVTEVERIA